MLLALATAISWVFFFKVLQPWGVSRVPPVEKLSIVFVIILVFIFLAEKPARGNVLGGTLVTT